MRVSDQSYKELAVKGGSDKWYGAYYYGFDLTGVPEIDYILRAVASAGCRSHHTMDWNDDEGYDDDPSRSPVQHIQNAANDAAVAMRKLKGDVDD